MERNAGRWHKRRAGFWDFAVIRAIIMLLTITCVGLAEVVPPDRKYNWTSYTGVSGGIPVRTNTTNAFLYGCDKTGVTNCESQINALLAAMPVGYVLYFPAGTYKVGTLSTITRFSITIRGAGMGLTTWMMEGGTMQVGNGDWLPGPNDTPTITVTNGATNGSTVLYVSSTNLLQVNYLVILTQTNSPDVHWHTNTYSTGPTDDGHANDRLQAATFRVTAVSANSVTLNVPLPCNFTNAPKLTTFAQYVNANMGFEDLTLNMSNTTANSGITFNQVWNCWLKNIEVVGASRRQFWFSQAINCEIVGCITRDSIGSGPNHEGIDLYQNCCWFRVYDNICLAGSPQIILGDFGGGCAGNVVAYNFVSNTISGSSVAGYSICDNHGPHNMFNLFEGNIAQNFCSDGYYGSSGYGTLIRNNFTGVYDRFHTISVNSSTDVLTANGHGKMDGDLIYLGGTSPPSPLAFWSKYFVRDATANTFKVSATLGGTPIDLTTAGVDVYFGYSDENAISLEHWSRYYTVAGNILGTSNYSTIYEASGFSYQDGLVYRVGFPNVGNRYYSGTGDNPSNADFYDTGVTNTIIRTHNWAWNYGSNVIDSSISGVVSNSYYLTAKPAWFSNAVWPTIGPDLSPMVNLIPAQMRALGMDYGTASAVVVPAMTIGPGTTLGSGINLR